MKGEWACDCVVVVVVVVMMWVGDDMRGVVCSGASVCVCVCDTQ